MEVRLRLQKIGKSAGRSTNYRIVALPRKGGRDSRTLDILGFYDPSKKPAAFKLDKAKVESWVSKGAQMSDTVKSLMKKTK